MASSPLANLTELEAQGRVVYKNVRTRNGEYRIRWQIVGLLPVHYRGKLAGSARMRAVRETGRVGNRFVLLRRLDNHSKAEPRDSYLCVGKDYLTSWREPAWLLEDKDERPDKAEVVAEGANAR